MLFIRFNKSDLIITMLFIGDEELFFDQFGGVVSLMAYIKLFISRPMR
jgi:hypothetical protein